MASGEFPHLRDEDLPAEAVEVALGYVKGILWNASDVRRSEEQTARNVARAVLQSVGWEPTLHPPTPIRFTHCFVCGLPMPDASEGQMCWGVPGRGVAHEACYSLGGEAS